MTPEPEKRKLSIDEQIRLMEQTGAYTHSSEAQPPPIGTTPQKRSYEQVPEPVDPRSGPVQPSSPPGGLADYAPSAHGNPSDRSGGTNIPPKTTGLELPLPFQL